MTMKKILMVGLGFWLCSFSVSAQTWDEWFSQKKTQKKYLIQQIAALKVYLKYLKEGYDVAKKGLGMIGDIKDGNFNDHSTYFQSLGLVNPTVKNASKVALIVVYQSQIISEFRTLDKECKRDPNLTADEVRYVHAVYNNLLQQCESSIDGLNTLITDNTSQLKDDERIERVDQIYEDMKDKYAFTRSFSNSTRMLMTQRAHELQESVGSKKLIDIL